VPAQVAIAWFPPAKALSAKEKSIAAPPALMIARLQLAFACMIVASMMKKTGTDELVDFPCLAHTLFNDGLRHDQFIA
jgi:hypothetical protein